MKSTILQVVPLRKKSLLQAIFKQSVDDNAVIELNNVLATKPIQEISLNDIQAIELQHKVNLKEQYYRNLEEFYAVYLNYFLTNNTITDQAVFDLNHLCHILSLSEKSVEFLHRKIGEGLYRKTYENAIANGRMTSSNEHSLDDLAQRLKLPQDLTDEISEEYRKTFIKNYIGKIIDDQRYSPTEEIELQSIATSLKIDLKFDADLNFKLQKLKEYWKLENLPLSTIQTNIVLQKGESCFIQISNVYWYEPRTVRQRVGHTGYSASIKIAKGFYLKSSSYKPSYYTREELRLIDYGTLYLTNKRIILIGQTKNSNIRLEKILQFAPYGDGVEIGKDTGKSPLLKIANNADFFCIILGRLLNNSNT
jgi:hypothetical protein